jgi:hypothetical protein
MSEQNELLRGKGEGMGWLPALGKVVWVQCGGLEPRRIAMVEECGQSGNLSNGGSPLATQTESLPLPFAPAGFQEHEESV